MKRFFHAVASILPLAAMAGGCTSYNYRVLQPPADAGTVATDADFSILQRDPLTYRLRVKDNRLVVLIFNPTDGQIRLLGDKSVVVDPNGQSHPIQGQAIAPGSYGKLILPPPTPEIRGYGPGYYGGPGFYGPGIGLGIGTTIGRATHKSGVVQTAFLANRASSDAVIYRVFDQGNNYFWDWKGETTARLTLVYEKAAGGGFTHEFTFGREKAK